ncbi:MAG: TPM domain-containing protein [Deinococcus sp.]|nr:TPM domain-containing protein [Deinococcus sp.]
MKCPRCKGLMMLLALEERCIEGEVGYALEHIVSDEESGAILDALKASTAMDCTVGRRR